MDGMTPKIQYTDEMANFAETGELFDKPTDFDQAEPSYRIKIDACHDSTIGEMVLDSAELDFMQRLAEEMRQAAGISECKPVINIHRRIKPGNLEADENFIVEYGDE